MTPLLCAEHVTVRVGARTLINDVSLGFAAGEAVAIVGPNGAGKTTLLRILSGELRCDAGGVRLKGRPIRVYSPSELAAHRAVLSQSITVAFPFTVLDVVRMGLDHAGSSRDETLVEAALADVGLAGFAGRTITTLSGGEQQRAHFARILVQLACGQVRGGPGVLLLDEPTASLDLKHQVEMLMLVRRHVARGVTAIAVLHDLNLAALFADRIIVVESGVIRGDGPPATIVTTAMLDRVFGVALEVGGVPPSGVPFVLPQAIAMMADREAPSAATSACV